MYCVWCNLHKWETNFNDNQNSLDFKQITGKNHNKDTICPYMTISHGESHLVNENKEAGFKGSCFFQCKHLNSTVMYIKGIYTYTHMIRYIFVHMPYPLLPNNKVWIFKTCSARALKKEQPIRFELWDVTPASFLSLGGKKRAPPPPPPPHKAQEHTVTQSIC